MQNTFYVYLSFIDGKSFKFEVNRRQMTELENFIQEGEGFLRLHMGDGLEPNCALKNLPFF